jgi:hypothetical protein
VSSKCNNFQCSNQVLTICCDACEVRSLLLFNSGAFQSTPKTWTLMTGIDLSCLLSLNSLKLVVFESTFDNSLQSERKSTFLAGLSLSYYNAQFTFGHRTLPSLYPPSCVSILYSSNSSRYEANRLLQRARSQRLLFSDLVHFNLLHNLGHSNLHILFSVQAYDLKP